MLTPIIKRPKIRRIVESAKREENTRTQPTIITALSQRRVAFLMKKMRKNERERKNVKFYFD